MKKIVVLIVLIVFAACGGESTDSDPSDTDGADSSGDSSGTATLSSIQSEIFTPSCALGGCHSSTSAQAGLSLADGESFSNLVGVASAQATNLKRVAPGDPDNSYLVHKLEGEQATVGGSGSQMPQRDSALSESDINTIREWIQNGAQNN